VRFAKAPLYFAFLVATGLFIAACSTSQPSMPGVKGAHAGSVRMRHAIDGVVTGNEYRYHGCKVYGPSNPPMLGDPYANANIANASIDSGSSTILGAHSVSFATSSDADLEIVNIATNSTTTYSVASTSPGHTPPISTPVPSGYSGTGPVPWRPTPLPAPFLFEGTHPNNCPNDCHWTTLNTSNCYVYEGDAEGGGFNGGVFSTYNGIIDDLSASYASQWLNKGDNWSVSGIPGLGFTDFGEDFTLSSINHPLQVIFPASIVQSGANGVNLSPGVGNDGSCSTSCFEYGDILRLKSSVSCGSDAKTALVCNQLKTYGAMVADTGDAQFRFGLDSSGNDPIASDSTLWTWMGARSLNNFELITRGALVP
jgi:hypothetical protein